jgi:hypothetical protein
VVSTVVKFWEGALLDRNILLVEPAYKTKFPPLGLMKISAYHQLLGDNVRFVKGINQQVTYDNYWHRVYISTVFTYNWKITIETIKYYKYLVKDDNSRIFVGGIMASLMANEVWKETGIVPVTGVLCNPGIFDKDNDYVIDNLIPDYSLFKGVNHKYTLIDDSYFGYATRGCIRKCAFCGVPKLEPRFEDYEGIKDYINGISSKYGEKCNLVLFDNNVLASKKFDKIVSDLLDLGFERNSKFAYKNKANVTTYRSRRVDFNQGTDARLMTDKKVAIMSKLALNPLRIAFDHIKDQEIYKEKVRLSAKHGINNLSNYILYNFDDTPEDLWKRLKINIDLNKELGLEIYSFPMKYIPLNAKDRSFVNHPNWNWQFLRGVQRILNVLKGPVMTKKQFFYRAFGRDEKEFIQILYMPESILMNRTERPKSAELEWVRNFSKLTTNEKSELLEILCKYRKKLDLKYSVTKINNSKLKKMIEYYLPVSKVDQNLKLFDMD